MPTVTGAVEALVRATVDLPDDGMARPWAWNEYDEEGLRFALLMAQHELRDLAVRLAALRTAPPTQAQRILAQYHEAYRDLTGALAGLHDADLDVAPAPGEWPVRGALEHMVGADVGFLAVIQWSRSADAPRDEADMNTRRRKWREDHGYMPPAVTGGIADVRNLLFEIHRRVLRELADLSDAELEQPALFWDGAKPLRFRLHRFEAHYIQHTIQIDKTLDAIGRRPSEAHRLVRVLYRDLAGVEMLADVAGTAAAAARDEVATTFERRAAELAGTLV